MFCIETIDKELINGQLALNKTCFHEGVLPWGISSCFHEDTNIYIHIFVQVGRRLLFKQVLLNDKWHARFTIFRDIRSISLKFNLIFSLLIHRMTKESYRLRYLFCELSNITLFIIMPVFQVQKFSKQGTVFRLTNYIYISTNYI